MAPQRPWKTCLAGMLQQNFQFPYAQNRMWNIPMPWQPWPRQGNFPYPATSKYSPQSFYLQQMLQQQLPAQQVSNLDNKSIQSTHNIGMAIYPTYPTYYIAPHPLQEIYVPLLRKFPTSL